MVSTNWDGVAAEIALKVRRGREGNGPRVGAEGKMFLKAFYTNELSSKKSAHLSLNWDMRKKISALGKGR